MSQDPEVLEAVVASAVTSPYPLSEAFDRLTQNLKEVTEAGLEAFKGFRRYVALYGPAKARKRLARQSGVNFARYEHGRLVHYKRLEDGLLVRV